MGNYSVPLKLDDGGRGAYDDAMMLWWWVAPWLAILWNRMLGLGDLCFNPAHPALLQSVGCLCVIYLRSVLFLILKSQEVRVKNHDVAYPKPCNSSAKGPLVWHPSETDVSVHYSNWAGEENESWEPSCRKERRVLLLIGWWEGRSHWSFLILSRPSSHPPRKWFHCHSS